MDHVVNPIVFVVQIVHVEPVARVLGHVIVPEQRKVVVMDHVENRTVFVVRIVHVEPVARVLGHVIVVQEQ